MDTNQTVKTYSLGLIKEQGIEPLQGLPVMTKHEAENALSMASDLSFTNAVVINIESE